MLTRKIPKNKAILRWNEDDDGSIRDFKVVDEERSCGKDHPDYAFVSGCFDKHWINASPEEAMFILFTMCEAGFSNERCKQEFYGELAKIEEFKWVQNYYDNRF